MLDFEKRVKAVKVHAKCLLANDIKLLPSVAHKWIPTQELNLLVPELRQGHPALIIHGKKR